jgi:hypothetical protein
MALDKIDNINVSLAGGASRAQKLRATARTGKAGVTTRRSWLSHCGAEVTGARHRHEKVANPHGQWTVTFGVDSLGNSPGHCP